MKVLAAAFLAFLALAAAAFAQAPDTKEVPLTLEEFNDLWSQLESAPVAHKITGPMEAILQKAALRAVAPKVAAPAAAAPQPAPAPAQP